MSDPGNAAQVRIIADQVADAAVKRFVQEHPAHPAQPVKAEIPAILKWAGGIISAILIGWAVTTANTSMATLTELRVTVARIDERQQQDQTGKRLDQIEERLSRLEQRKGGE